MTVYILGAGASCCTDAYRDLESPWDFRPPVMARFFQTLKARHDIRKPVEVERILRPFGIGFDDLQKETPGFANMELVLSMRDLLERTIGAWLGGKADPPSVPVAVVRMCRGLKGWPIFGDDPQAKLVEVATALTEASAKARTKGVPHNIARFTRAYMETLRPTDGLFKSIYEVFAPSQPYEPAEGVRPPQPCSNYLSFHEKLGAGDTVITFNYDFLLDRVLEEKGDLRVQSVDARLPNVFNTRDGQARYLKLHGSVLWYNRWVGKEITKYYLGDRNAGEVGYKRFDEAVRHLHGGRWPWLPPESQFEQRTFRTEEEAEAWEDSQVRTPPEEQVRIRPLLVPPTIVKEEHLLRPAVKKLWDEARRALSEASEIYVIGYSFPESDKHVTDMTHSAGKSRSAHGDYNGVPIRIVSKESPEGLKDLRKRVEGAFPRADVRVETNEGFERWLREGTA